MSAQPVRYTSADDDNERWLAFTHRPGDIVISTRSKHGTTWMQMICALLVFQTPTLPRPLHELSPWLDWRIEPIDALLARLDAQRHRRFIKTHTPLDGLPLNSATTYIVVARDPLDARVSLYHHSNNLDRARIAELTGGPAPAKPAARPALHDYLLEWIDGDARPRDALESLNGVLWHVGDAWRRRDAGNVVLVHYSDLVADLDLSMRALAARLGIVIDPAAWPGLVEAASFDRMQQSPAANAPDPAGVLHDAGAFFRRGTSGAGADAVTAAELAHYRDRVRGVVGEDLAAWLLR